eukprot:584264-Alexandrium_andersonii.AAC.1
MHTNRGGICHFDGGRTVSSEAQRMGCQHGGWDADTLGVNTASVAHRQMFAPWELSVAPDRLIL